MKINKFQFVSKPTRFLMRTEKKKNLGDAREICTNSIVYNMSWTMMGLRRQKILATWLLPVDGAPAAVLAWPAHLTLINFDESPPEPVSRSIDLQRAVLSSLSYPLLHHTHIWMHVYALSGEFSCLCMYRGFGSSRNLASSKIGKRSSPHTLILRSLFSLTLPLFSQLSFDSFKFFPWLAKGCQKIFQRSSFAHRTETSYEFTATFNLERNLREEKTREAERDRELADTPAL